MTEFSKKIKYGAPASKMIHTFKMVTDNETMVEAIPSTQE